MTFKECYEKIHKNHREIRQITVENFLQWLNSKSRRGTFSLMQFTKTKNNIICEKENTKINSCNPMPLNLH